MNGIYNVFLLPASVERHFWHHLDVVHDEMAAMREGDRLMVEIVDGVFRVQKQPGLFSHAFETVSQLIGDGDEAR